MVLPASWISLPTSLATPAGVSTVLPVGLAGGAASTALVLEALGAADAAVGDEASTSAAGAGLSHPTESSDRRTRPGRRVVRIR